MDQVTFYNGNVMPKLGFGTYRIEDDTKCKEAVQHAIEVGYRSIDTAMVYENEQAVGEGIRAGLESTGLTRNDLFITSKLWLDDYGSDNVEAAYETSLKKLGLDYLDLYLMHWPGTDEALMVDTWRGMEALYRDNKVKNIGVSNFNVSHLEALFAQVSIKPVINQIEFHPYFLQKELNMYLDVQNILMESWSPLLNGDLLQDATVQSIADEVDRSPAQVIIRWNLQHNVVVIPKSQTPARIEESINVFDFELTEDQMSTLDQLNEDKRTGPDPDHYHRSIK
ncbi:aldo/keto reductase [Staphylococcus auricularis]|uniref:aldo/keto reductase n=1 Tax=Staphylococcus auricularis TaxID=29379 RepID=UPI00242D7368|nr:aldo/keto reductase [Staphylococcus auricularis]